MHAHIADLRCTYLYTAMPFQFAITNREDAGALASIRAGTNQVPVFKLHACLRRIPEGLLLKCYSPPVCQPPQVRTNDNVLLAKTTFLGEEMVLPSG
jgi:hypothetical protein